MRKIIVFIIVLLIPILTFAKEYEDNNINIKLDIKDELIVLTRDNLDNNSDLANLNITKETMENMMKNNNIYFDIIKKDLSYEILVIVPKTGLEFRNLANVNDQMLDDLRKELVKKTGAEVSSVYKAKHNYILVDYYDEKTSYYIVNYYTVVNANGYNFQLQKKTPITDNDKKELKEIVDTVNIKVLDEYKNETKEIQEKIDNYDKTKKGFDYMSIVYGALIGALAGLVSYVIGIFIRKKKSSM